MVPLTTALASRVHDGTEYSAGSYSMTVNVTNVNVSPTTTDDSYTVNEDGTLTVDWWDTDWTRRQQLISTTSRSPRH